MTTVTDSHIDILEAVNAIPGCEAWTVKVYTAGTEDPEVVTAFDHNGDPAVSVMKVKKPENRHGYGDHLWVNIDQCGPAVTDPSFSPVFATARGALHVLVGRHLEHAKV